MVRNLLCQLFAVVQSACACFVTVHEIGKRIDRLFVNQNVDFDNVAEIAANITPVPGGVGPLTRAMLLQNTLMAARLQTGIK